MTKKLKNFRVQDGCYNCINMEDLSDHDTGNIFLCKLQFPDFNRDTHYYLDEYLDENGVCDDWKKDQGEEDMSVYYRGKRQASPPPTLAELMAKSRKIYADAIRRSANDLVK